MKLNFFTPLPPAESDVAKCVARFLPVLVERAKVTLWTNGPTDREVRRLCEVRRFDPGSTDWRPLNYADFNVYNIGNDARFHADIVEIAHSCPGVIIMHDACVHELMKAVLERGGGNEHYLAVMRREGPEGVEAAKSVVAGRIRIDEIARRFPMAKWALAGAIGAVSHNAAALGDAAPNLAIPILDAPLPWLPRKSIPPVLIRERGKGRLEMAICGFLNSPSRRLNEVLEALAAFPRRDAILLHIAGRVADDKALEGKIAALGLGRNVKLHGFLSENALKKLLDRAHLAMNLRWPSVGEASGAQLRFWNHSLPTIATRTAWYAAQPEGSLQLVDPLREREDLHRFWDAALDDYPAFAAVGPKGRAVLEERHGAEVFVEALLDFLPAAARYRSTAFVDGLASRAGNAIGRAGMQGETAQLAATNAARAIAEMAGINY